jgi:hypothetical protein
MIMSYQIRLLQFSYLVFIVHLMLYQFHVLHSNGLTHPGTQYNLQLYIMLVHCILKLLFDELMYLKYLSYLYCHSHQLQNRMYKYIP